MVKSKHGDGRVVDTQILTQLVVIEREDGVRVAVPVEEVEIIHESAVKKSKPDKPADDKGRENNKDEVTDC